jgi:ABC-2 type transport system permease protein
VNVVRILRLAAYSGFQDYATVYTWKTWVTGWYVRVLAQVVFFALIGRLLGDEERVHYLLVGNSVMLAGIGSLFAVAGTTWERRAGTLPLLVASPTSPALVFSGRSAWALTEGTVSSIAVFYVAAAIFDVPLAWPRALLYVPLVVLVALSCYALGTFLGGLVLRAMELRNVVANIVWGTMLAVCGVMVPLSFYPEPVQWLAHALPLTHGLQAIRDALAGGDAGAVLRNAGFEALVGLFWLTCSLVTFDRLAEGGRRDGSIEFAS